MNQPSVPEVLLRPRQLKREYDSLVMKYETLKTSLERTVTVLSLAPGHGNGLSRRLEDLEAEMLDLEKQIYEKKKDLIDSMKEVKSLIWTLKNPVDSVILEKRFVDLLSWSQIAEETHYSKPHCMNIFSSALEKLTASYR